jgi:hypothetical protein
MWHFSEVSIREYLLNKTEDFHEFIFRGAHNTICLYHLWLIVPLKQQRYHVFANKYIRRNFLL